MRQGELFDGLAFPEGLDYVEQFIDVAEEQQLIAVIQKLPLAEARYKEYTAKRRTLSFGSQYDFAKNELGPSAGVPPFLHSLRARVGAALDIDPERFAHALITEYRPRTALGWHRDVPDFDVIAGISLGAVCRMRFRPYPVKRGRPAMGFELDLEPRSTYFMRGPARWRWQHAIAPTEALRYSITFRTLRTGRSGAE